MTERPFLDASGVRALELGIRCVEFQFHYLTVLLIKSQRHLRDECLEASQNALLLLDGLISGSVDVYNGVVWHILYCPFTPFFVLFAHVVAAAGSTSSERALEAMEHLPFFLKEMQSRHPLAGKLSDVAYNLFERAKSINESAIRGAAGVDIIPHSSATLQGIRVDAATGTNDPLDMSHLDIENMEFLRGFFPAIEPPLESERLDSQANEGIETTVPSYTEEENDLSSSKRNTQLPLDASQPVPHEQQYEFLAESMFDWFAWESYGDIPRQ